ncbi:hypothetical protein CcaCcLH18_06264 [Colletotrichum camelliae]|nr:hypothetical protein CcaCcLH18_06264 [Colletotrichum camelliae]
MELVKAALSKAKSYVFDLIESGVDVNSYNSFGNTVLMDFVAFVPEDLYTQDDEILQFLIDVGARLEARNREGRTALLIAACCGRKAAMKTLIRAGARLRVQDAQGNGPKDIISRCLADRDTSIDEYADYEGCLQELATDNAGCGSVSVVEEWALPHRECTNLRSKASPAVASKLDELVAGLHSQKASLKDSEPSLIAKNDDAPQMSVPRRPLVDSTMEVDNKTIRSVRTTSSSHSSAEDMNFLTDEMCEMILSYGFGSSMDDIPNPQEAWDSVRRCLGELSVINEDAQSFFQENQEQDFAREPEDNEDSPQVSARRVDSLPSSTTSKKRDMNAFGQGEEDMNGDESDPDEEDKRRDKIANASVMDDLEDGVTMDIVSKLRDRRVKMGVTTWESLWQALFPDDQCAKSEDFEPIIEIDEVKNAFERKAGKCASALQKVSSTMILMTGKTSHEEFRNIDKSVNRSASATQLERL